MTPTYSLTTEDRLNALEDLAKQLIELKPLLLKLDKVILQNPGFCPPDELVIEPVIEEAKEETE